MHDPRPRRRKRGLDWEERAGFVLVGILLMGLGAWTLTGYLLAGGGLLSLGAGSVWIGLRRA